MPRRVQRPLWDVLGHMVLCHGGMSRAFEYRFRSYADGRILVDVDGVTYAVPRHMTAHEYLHNVYRNMFGDPEERRACGD